MQRGLTADFRGAGRGDDLLEAGQCLLKFSGLEREMAKRDLRLGRE